MLLLLYSAFMLSVVKLLLKGEIRVCALNKHGNYIVDHDKSWKNHGIVFFEFLWEPCSKFYHIQPEKCTCSYKCRLISCHFSCVILLVWIHPVNEKHCGSRSTGFNICQLFGIYIEDLEECSCFIEFSKQVGEK